MQEEMTQGKLQKDVFSEEHIKELRRRGDAHKYFEGAGDFRSGEGFGYIVGGGLLIIMGAFVFPLLLGGHSASGIEKYLFWLMTAAGIVLGLKGVFTMRTEDKTPRVPISDARFQEIADFDSGNAKKTAEEALTSSFGLSAASEYIHLTGPNYYAANRHIPLLWKADETGKIRYSNFALVTLVFDEEAVYSHTCIVNHRDGIVSKSHTYRYDRDKLKELLIEDRLVERLTTEQKIEEKNVLMMMIRIDGKEDINELSVVLADHEVEKKTGGHFDEEETRTTAELIARRIGEGKALLQGK